MKINFDSNDLVFAVCLIGGFWTGNWIPTFVGIAVYLLARHKDNPTSNN